jgi:hypothetical protein
MVRTYQNKLKLKQGGKYDPQKKVFPAGVVRSDPDLGRMGLWDWL